MTSTVKKYLNLSAAFGATAMLAACAGNPDTGGSLNAGVAPSYGGGYAQPMEPQQAAPATVSAPRPMSPYTGRVLDRTPVFERCNMETGQVYRAYFQKMVDGNGAFTVVEIPVSLSVGFRGRVNPVSCAIINGPSELSKRAYTANPGGSGYNGTFNRVPVIRN